MTIYLAGLIPLTIFLLNFHQINLKKILKKILMFLFYYVTFFVYYYLEVFSLRKMIFFSTTVLMIYYFIFTSSKFYLIGLFYPYEHIYVYATNYDLNLAIILFTLFIIYSIFATYLFF